MIPWHLHDAGGLFDADGGCEHPDISAYYSGPVVCDRCHRLLTWQDDGRCVAGARVTPAMRRQFLCDSTRRKR